MSFRVSALVAAVAVLGFGSLSPAFAQPQVPIRPRYSAFQSVFRPGQVPLVNPGQGILGFNGPGFVNPNGPQVPGFAFPGQQFVLPNQAGYPQVLPGALAVNPMLMPTGIPGTFNNFGHWYGNRTGYYGHWYPNGIANGYGVLGIGASGLGYSGFGYGATGTGGLMRPSGSVLGTTLLGAAAIGQMRR